MKNAWFSGLWLCSALPARLCCCMQGFAARGSSFIGVPGCLLGSVETSADFQRNTNKKPQLFQTLIGTAFS